MPTKADPWACEYCSTHYVAPVLARDCELKHLSEAEAADTADIEAQDG